MHTAASRTSGWVGDTASQMTQPTLFQILENTLENHVDHSSLKLALERAEELCSQVNEGVREKENSDRLEWIQAHVQCEGLAEVRPVVLSWVPLGGLWWGTGFRPSPAANSLCLRPALVDSTILPLLGVSFSFLIKRNLIFF